GTICALDRTQKDVATLIEAFAAIAGDLPGASLDIYGDGKDRKHLEQLAMESGAADRVKFHGWWDRDIFEALNRMDIFVLSSLKEGTSNVLIAAMAAGLPAIATKAGGNPEVLGEAGILTPPKDVQAMAQAIKKLADDKELRERLAVFARERAKLFTIDRTIGATIQCYLEVCR
ncbi:MAG: glycosyltransferase, partial [Elusimicrobia bacterium]|nr:glycosyltransferase [Elusimicrobiota bacterium]